MIDLQVDSAGDFLYVKQYTDDAVEAILDGARRLQDLSIRNQSLITLKSPWFRHGFVHRAGHFSLRRTCTDVIFYIRARQLPYFPIVPTSTT